MEVVVARIAGLDVHKETVMACVAGPGRGRPTPTRGPEFSTFTAELARLKEWLVGEGVTQVVMEATGVYWRPVWHVLEDHGGWELMLVNARHVKNLPGRKTDVSGSAWLAQLGECGLLRSSFVPPPVIAQLRDLTRYRKKLVEDRAKEGPARPEGPRGRRDQARVGGQRRDGQGQPTHARRPHRRRAATPMS